MIPRHPGDPERLPKVSKRLPKVTPYTWGHHWAGSGLGATDALGRGVPDTPNPVPIARPTGAGSPQPVPGHFRVGEGLGEGYRALVSHCYLEGPSL